MKIFAALLFLLLTSTAFAGGGEFECFGSIGKKSVALKGSYPGLMSLNSSRATLFVDGREVSRFYPGDMKIKKIAKTVYAKNNHGDVVRGSVVSMKTGEMYASLIMVPGYGIFAFGTKLMCSVYN